MRSSSKVSAVTSSVECAQPFQCSSQWALRSCLLVPAAAAPGLVHPATSAMHLTSQAASQLAGAVVRGTALRQKRKSRSSRTISTGGQARRVMIATASVDPERERQANGGASPIEKAIELASSPLVYITVGAAVGVKVVASGGDRCEPISESSYNILVGDKHHHLVWLDAVSCLSSTTPDSAQPY